MDTETRKESLAELMRHESNVAMTGIPLRYRGATTPMKVYKIPLDFLIYNRYNGRIGSDVLSYEKQNGELNPENPTDRVIIEKFLYDSKKDRNDITLKNLQIEGQRRYGVVTADGIIVDGNRRAMLLNKLFHEYAGYGYTFREVDHCKYFLAIILPDDATPQDIQELETRYQMGEDDKLDYNPIEKYLKCKQLKTSGFSNEKIAEFMSEKPGKIKEWLAILDLMEKYLDEYGYTGIYTRLEKTEGPFVDLQGYLDSYENRRANIRNIDWAYSDSDVSDLQTVCFDYIRARYEGKEFRDIAGTGKNGSIFFHEELWKAFFAEHIAKVGREDETVEEMRQKYPDEDLSRLLKKRDDDWKDSVKGQLQGNLQRFSRKLEDKRDANKPADLIERALSALLSVDQEQDSFFADPQIEEMVKEIGKITWEMKKRLEKR